MDSHAHWLLCLLVYDGESGYDLEDSLCCLNACSSSTRTRQGHGADLDEVNVLDQFFANEKLAALFKVESYHVIDFDQEWEQGHDNPYFPEYKTNVAKFFNADMNTTVGSYKIGDLESGATCTLYFKTMPFSNNKYN